jgi:hypothetical protein
MRPGLNKGQAAVEYVLLVLVVTVVFGWLFQQIRRDLFQLWVCEIGPRIQSPVPCHDRNECFEIIINFTNAEGQDYVRNQRDVCSSMD